MSKERDMRYSELTKARDALPLSKWDYVDLLELHLLLCMEVDEKNAELMKEAPNNQNPEDLYEKAAALKRIASYTANRERKKSTYFKERQEAVRLEGSEPVDSNG